MRATRRLPGVSFKVIPERAIDRLANAVNLHEPIFLSYPDANAIKPGLGLG